MNWIDGLWGLITIAIFVCAGWLFCQMILWWMEVKK